MSEASILWTAIAAGGLAVIYGLILTGWIMKQSAGSEKMRDIASIPGLETLRAQFVFMINSPLQRLAIALDQVAAKRG